MGTCQGQRDDDCSGSLRGCSPHATGKPLGQRRGLAPHSPFQFLSSAHPSAAGFRDATALREAPTGPAPSPNDTQPKSGSAAVNTAPLPRGPGASGAARRSGQPSEAPREAPRACEAAFWAARARRPRTPRAGRGRGGRSAPAAPSRPGPEGDTGLRSRAPEVPSAPPVDPAQRYTAPSPKASASPPTPQPRRQARSTCPAAGGRRAAGAEPAPIAPTGEGRDSGQDGARLLVRRSGVCSYASRSFLVGWKRCGGGASHVALEQRGGPAGDTREPKIPMEGVWVGPLVPDARAKRCCPFFFFFFTMQETVVRQKPIDTPRK